MDQETRDEREAGKVLDGKSSRGVYVEGGWVWAARVRVWFGGFTTQRGEEGGDSRRKRRTWKYASQELFFCFVWFVCF